MRADMARNLKYFIPDSSCGVGYTSAPLGFLAWQSCMHGAMIYPGAVNKGRVIQGKRLLHVDVISDTKASKRSLFQ